MSFEELGLHPDLLKAVQALGFTQPTPIQEKTIPLALQGIDVLGGAQTGSGKTAAFALPILDALRRNPRPGLRALVLVPTRELAEQVDKTFHECGRFMRVKTAVVIGGVGYHHQRMAVRHGAQVLVATPGRLLDHLQQGSFRLNQIEHVVLDEADRMLDMGFLPSIRAVIQQLPRERQTMLFSATLHFKVEQIASFALKKPQRVEIAKPTATAEGISQVVYPVPQFQKADFLIALLKAVQMKSVLVFCRTRHGADRLARRLTGAGFSVGILHASKTQNQRSMAMDSFRKGAIQILVATDIAARGIDVKEISHVINYDVPLHAEDYVHRVGRTARAYAVGDAITLMDVTEQGLVASIEKFTSLIFPRAMLPDFSYAYPPRLDPPKPNATRPGRGGRRNLPRRFGR